MEPVADAVRLFRSTREWIAPILTQSAFLERGVLTPEEFVRCGDHLVSSCPSWSWCAGEASKTKTYLPEQKQFLLTRGVPCYQRVSRLCATEIEDHTDNGEESGDWQVPTLTIQQDNANISANISANVSSSSTPNNKVKQEEEDEYLDMEDESLALDESTVAMPSTQQPADSQSSSASSSSSSCIRLRRYDISITYDKYYQTPRIWLFGYDESGSPLSNEAVFEDIISDYAKKTVTIDPHPHLSHYHASIHPCQHGPAMKSLLEQLVECGKTPNVDQYLFVFLKFIQSVIPTIEYDNTVDVNIGIVMK